jgi:hypothetical protein
MVTAIAVCTAFYALGLGTGFKVRRVGKKQPQPSYCKAEWSDKYGANWSCQRIWTTCRSGLCSNHCKDFGCGCCAHGLSDVEKEVLHELRELEK